jgi:DNA repair exonuclease SbcCD ATPase subunit
MKLTLKNFKCYSNKTFEFEDETITLIHGPSGHGKSTILLAIEFVLYGSKNHKYLISHNKTTCEVNLEYKNFKIKRTKRPNILNLYIGKDFYEDKEAQVVINKYFGYNYGSKFMDLSHLEKLEFLEKIVAEDYDIKNLKNLIKLQISNLNKELALLDGQILNAENVLEIIKKPIKVEKPLEIEEYPLLNNIEIINLEKDKVLYDLKLENKNKEKFKNLMVKCQVLTEEINTIPCRQLPKGQLSTEIQNIGNLISQLENENIHLNKVKETLKELEKYKDVNNDKANALNLEIKSLDTLIEKAVKFKDYNDYKKQKQEYEVLLNQEMIEWKNKADFIQKEINLICTSDSTQSPFGRLATSNRRLDGTNIDDLNHLEKICVEYENCEAFNLKNNLSNIESQIEALKLKYFKSYNCNKCNHKFLINMDTLEMMDDDKLPNILNGEEEKVLNCNVKCFDVKKSLQNLENLKDRFIQNEIFLKSTNINEIKDQIGQIKTYLKLIEKLNSLKLFKPSNFLQQMNNKLASCEYPIAELNQVSNEHEDPSLSINDLKDERRDLTIEYNNLAQQLKIKNTLLKKISFDESYDLNHHIFVKKSIEENKQFLNMKHVELEKVKNFERLNDQLNTLKEEIKVLKYNDKIIPQLEQNLIDLNLKYDYCVKFSEYKNFQVNLKKYKKIKDTIKNFKITKQEKENTYLKTLIFKQKVVESEHESLQCIINTINSHLTILLNDFFSENFGDPIQIYLTIEIPQGNSKPQLNTVINYKGNKVDYKSLSTGEYSRVKLAFDLTFKEILGENIIMLDECTANLDQDLSTKIFNKIKATFPSKTILVVAHQVIVGAFDHVLSL